MHDARHLYHKTIAAFPHSAEMKFAVAELRSLSSTTREPLSSPEPVLLTTTPSLANHRILETIDIVSAECAFGINVLRDLFTSVTDVFGGRSESLQKPLREAKVRCLRELREEARKVGANAVLGVDMDYSEFSGGGKSMVFLVATGTAVRVAPLAKVTNEPRNPAP